MNWDAIGAIAELLGAAGVVASLIYLGVQIRQNTRTERARAFLSGGDKLRFDHLMLGYFNALEATIFSKNAFLLGEGTLENWAYALRTRFLPYPGMRDWWNEAKSMFAPETRVWVDELISATDTSSDHLGLK